jgi:hypothetical protein
VLRVNLDAAGVAIDTGEYDCPYERSQPGEGVRFAFGGNNLGVGEGVCIGIVHQRRQGVTRSGFPLRQSNGLFQEDIAVRANTSVEFTLYRSENNGQCNWQGDLWPSAGPVSVGGTPIHRCVQRSRIDPGWRGEWRSMRVSISDAAPPRDDGNLQCP